MLRWIIASSLQLRILVVVIAALVMVIGISQLREAPIDVLPEFSQPYVEIQTESLGLSAEEVELLITTPMEQDLLNGLPWVDTIRSDSVPGLSSVVIVFQRGTDLMRARQMVSERMTQAVALPHVSKPPIMLQPLSATSRLMAVGLSSKSLSKIQMSVLARWTIAPRLMGVPGVANVSIWGQRDRQLQVQVDPKRLQDKKVSLVNVLETTGNALWVSSLSFVEASTPGTGGFIDTSNQRLGIRHILPIVSPEGLSQVPIEDTKLHLGDVANVVEDHQPLIGDALTNGGDGLLLVVEKFPGANTLEVTHGVEEALAELHPGLPGVDYDANVFRPADFIETAISHFGSAALVGAIMVALVFVVFFFELRTALISFVAIPLSLVAAGLVIYLSGATINMMVLTGALMALGVVVFSTVCSVDNMARRLRQQASQQNFKARVRLILESAFESSSTILYSALIVILAVTPALFMGGLTGAFFRPLAVAYGLAVLASAVVALTVTPALCLMFLPNRQTARGEPPFAGWLQQLHAAMLARTVHGGRLAFFAAGLMAVACIAMLPLLSRSPLPTFKELSLQIHLNTVPGTSQPETSRIAGLIGKELRSLDGVHNVATHIGRAVRGDQLVNVNSAQLLVSIDPEADYDKTAHAIQAVVDGYPGIKYHVQTYLREKSRKVAAESENNVVVRVYGDTHTVLQTKAEDIKKAITGIDGIAGLRVNLPIQQAVLEAEVDLTAAQKYGLKPGDVRRAAATMLSGIVVGSLYENQMVFDVVVWSTPETRHSIDSIRDLQIDTPSGGSVRLGDVAQVRVVPSASIVRHEAVKRYVDVTAEVKGRDLAAVATDIKSRLENVTFPLEYYARVLGDYAAPKAARTQLIILVLGALAGVLFVLQASFGNWRLAAIAATSIPAALAGGMLTIYLTGGVASLGSFAGLFAVAGIAICCSVTLIRHCQHLTPGPAGGLIDSEVARFRAQFDLPGRVDSLESANGDGFGPTLILRAARERLLPILVTVLASGLALAPVLFMGDLPGFEIARPMAMVVLGGLVTFTLFILLGLPAMILLLGPSRGDDLGDLSIALISDEDMREAMSRVHDREMRVESISNSN